MKKITFLIIILALALTACQPALTQLEENRQKWKQISPAHYQMKVQVSCFCAFMDKMPLTIEVRNGEMVSILDAQGNPPTEQEMEWFASYFTIESLFDFTQTVIQDADEVDVTYNAEYGFPEVVNIDYIKEAIDDELGVQVMEFSVLP